jgi:hypothetical protein
VKSVRDFSVLLRLALDWINWEPCLLVIGGGDQMHPVYAPSTSDQACPTDANMKGVGGILGQFADAMRAVLAFQSFTTTQLFFGFFCFFVCN